MADHTKIEWTDATWNPITGCSVISAGCKHCYAMKLAGTRMKHEASRSGLTIDTAAGPVWTGEVRFNAKWLDQPLRWRRPRRIFVCAHGDLFHENVPDAWIDRVFAVMALAPQHTFQVLTKRPERMHSYLQDSGHRTVLIGIDAASISGLDRDLPDGSQRWPLPMPNVWLGVSVENQDAANERIPLLLQTPAAVRWISAEPLLGPIDLRWLITDPTGNTRTHHGKRQMELRSTGLLHWVIAGGESGGNARPMHPNWPMSLRDQCANAGVPFLFKQWGHWRPQERLEEGGVLVHGITGVTEKACGLRGPVMISVGKKVAGRLLDGELHDGYPDA